MMNKNHIEIIASKGSDKMSANMKKGYQEGLKMLKSHRALMNRLKIR